MDELLKYFHKFAHPGFFYLLLLVPVLTVWYVLRKHSLKADVKVSSLPMFSGIKPSFKQRLRHVPFILRMLALLLLIVALARPQASSNWKTINSEGIDIIMALDISASMLAHDFVPNRLEASKVVATEFIDNRPDDRIGLVIFSGESFTQCPLTTDHAVIKNMFAAIKTGMIEDGTAIGLGLANAVSRLKDSKSKSKVVILLTDGVNNMGNIAPLTAAEIAKQFGVRVYTIAVGKEGKAYSPVAINALGEFEYDYVDVKIDKTVLQKIAEMTNGKYFRATDNDKLKNVYKEIDTLEKTKFNENSYTKKAEEFFPYLLAAFALLLIEFALQNTLLKSIC
jgi:Ca-activated chloride channel homolog